MCSYKLVGIFLPSEWSVFFVQENMGCISSWSIPRGNGDGVYVYTFWESLGWRLLYVFGILGFAIALAAILKRTYHLVWIALFHQLC